MQKEVKDKIVSLHSQNRVQALWTERTGKETARTTLQAEQDALGAKVEAEYVHNKTGS